MHNTTKNITQGAMFLAIFGAALMINRGLSFMFDQFVALLPAIVIIIYVARFGFKYGCMLSFGLLVIAFMFGGTYVTLYTPLSVIGGLVYGYGVSHDFDTKTNLLMTIIVFVIGEFIITALIIPVMGMGDFDEVLVMTEEMFKTFGFHIPSEMVHKIAKLSYGISILLIGILEAVLIHLLTIIIFKKFRIKELKFKPLSQMHLKPQWAYVTLLLIFLLMLAMQLNVNDTILFLLMSVTFIACLLLMVQGYIFFMLYGMIVLRKNIGIFLAIFIVLLMPISFFILTIVGFLYVTGPLQNYLDKQRSR